MQQKINTPFDKIYVFVIAAAIGAVAFSVFLFSFTLYPYDVLMGTDVFGHFFKINYLYDSIRDGVFYPIYTDYWYNTMELFRYWPPLSYYIVAFLEFITKGDVLSAYFVFGGVVYFINMMGWLLLGRCEKRMHVAFVLGNLYFFCPDNVRVFLGEGNIPRILIASLIPYAFYFTWEILHYKKYKHLIGLGVITWVITISHYMIAAMTGISIFIFCAIYSIMNKEWKQIIYITFDLGLAYMTMGIGLIPGVLGGGLTSQSSEASVSTISQWAQEAFKSLDPFYRVGAGMRSSFYFGIVIFVIALLGIIAADRKMGAGFITAILIFFSTTTAVSAVVRLLPMSQVFWMQRFVPMAMCVFFLSILVWKNLKRTAFVIFCAFMIIESVIELSLLSKTKEAPYRDELVAEVETYMLPEAKELTKNRLGILDYSLRGSIPSWYLSDHMDEKKIRYSYGWAYQGAETMQNIVHINEAAEGSFFEYSFDRFLELGDDVVLVDKTRFKEEDADAIKQAAMHVGYTLHSENDEAWIFTIEDVSGPIGIVREYKNFAIGSNAHEICYIYPDFAWGNSYALEDYSVEELAKYEKLYLSGFTYRDEETAEEFLNKVAESGVKIYIDMQHIPTDKLSGKTEFMGVYTQFVAFTEKFPVLSTNNGSQFKLDFRTAGYDTWNTVYLTGVSERIKEAYYDNATKLTYVATNGNPNIIFLGFNPVYYYHESKMPELLEFLNELFGEEYGKLSKTEIVPLEVTYEADKITVVSKRDNVNTGIANLECFIPSDGKEKKALHNILHVDKGTTVYDVKYSYFTLGITVSIIGFICSIFYWIIILKKEEDNGDETPDFCNDLCVSVCNADSCNTVK